ncbi:UNVERIFIED_CONTAM: hypothetical protein FKN15_023533 [Acipenser sinensis]
MENHQTPDPNEENPFLCFQRTPSLRRKWRKRYGGLDGNKLLEPNEEEDLPENGLMKDSHLERNSPQPRSAENQETLLVAKVGGLRIRTAPQGQKPVNLVSPGPTGASVFVNNRKQRSSSPHGEPLCHRNQFWNSITKAVWSSGIRKSDPRIKDCYLLMKKLQQADGTVDRNTFHRCVTGFVSFILKALQGRFVIPDFPTFTEETQKIFMKCKQLSSFKSELDSLENDSRKWGVSICTADGQRLSLGDCAEPCLLGECSWPLLYGIAVEQFSADYVHRYVGMEEFSKHDSSFTLTKQGIPHSPLVETGAIITSSLLQLAAGLGVEEEEKYESVLNLFRRLCNKGNVNLNCTRHQNLRKESIRLHCFPESVDIGAALDLMLQGFSTEVTCESGAAMAATLANGGLCPLSDDQVLGPSSVRNALSMMQTSIPAKSSKNGLVLAVVPGVMGIACWSPELDAFGNSWKGVHFCQELVSAFQLHSFDIRTPFRQVVTYRQWKAESEGYQIMNVLLAAYRGDVRSLRRYLLSGADVNSVDYDGRSALHVAASEGHLEVIKFLIENAGADHMATDRWGNTPLQESLRYRHIHAVQLLRRYKDHHESS